VIDVACASSMPPAKYMMRSFSSLVNKSPAGGELEGVGGNAWDEMDRLEQIDLGMNL